MDEKLALPAAARAWGTPSFADVLRRELAARADRLPLQQALSRSSVVAETPVTVLVHETGEREGRICATVGILFDGVISGCSCADDPAPDNLVGEYCRLRLEIDGDTAECIVSMDESA
jgi:hypothetical protein